MTTHFLNHQTGHIAYDDSGAGLSAEIVFTPTVAGDFFVQARQFNTRVVGRDSSYQLRIIENLPPTPTPFPPTSLEGDRPLAERPAG